jgi:ketosteroid isomerase-like protein
MTAVSHPHQDLVRTFYEAFQQRDAEKVNACYHDEATFTDEAFVGLNAAETRAMWAMLCSRATNFRLTLFDVRADDVQGSARWEAHYDYSPTGRRVRNIIEARFTFKESKILAHRDSFDLWRWSRQALGGVGLFLGWSPWLRARIQREAWRNLERFMAKQAMKR